MTKIFKFHHLGYQINFDTFFKKIKVSKLKEFKNIQEVRQAYLSKTIANFSTKTLNKKVIILFQYVYVSKES